jgi:hypothetical protein
MGTEKSEVLQGTLDLMILKFPGLSSRETLPFCALGRMSGCMVSGTKICTGALWG